MSDRPRAYRGLMDVLDDLLRGVRADGVAFDRSVLSPPWALRFAGGPSLTLCAPLSGEGWIVRDGHETQRVRLGETAIVRGPQPFVVTDEPPEAGRPPRTVRQVEFPGRAADRVDSDTVLLAGVYRMTGHVPRRLLRVLPPVLVLPHEHDCTPIHDYLRALVPGARSGRPIVLDRLMDWLLVCTLRDWFDRPGADPPGWYGALADDVVGPVLHAMHESPGEPWTLATLAGRAGVSRTTLATRFTGLVGEPPLSYLTEWRMALAADLLADPDQTVARVARRVGYADAFSFSAAFKRVQGVSPSEHRRAAGPGRRWQSAAPGSMMDG
jgi:AraC-like DNA-binding protein